MTNDTRAAFEAWYIERQRARGYGSMLTDAEFVGRMPDGRYKSLGLEDAFAAYRASRRAALEDAIKACDDVEPVTFHFGGQFFDDARGTIGACTAAIRALADEGMKD